MAECFCGCGRSIGFGHRRRANRLGRKMIVAVPMAAAVVDRLPQLAGDRELAELARTGAWHLSEVRRYVHTEIEREELDVVGVNDWHARWLRQSVKVATVAAAGTSG